MTNTERSTHSPASNAYTPPGAHVADTPKGHLASKGAAAFRDAKETVENVISDAGNYAGQKSQEALDNVRVVGDSLAVAIEKSLTRRPYTTLALAVATGFLLATWYRSK